MESPAIGPGRASSLFCFLTRGHKPPICQRVLSVSVAALAVLFGALGRASESSTAYLSLSALSLVVAFVLNRYRPYPEIAPIAPSNDTDKPPVIQSKPNNDSFLKTGETEPTHDLHKAPPKPSRPQKALPPIPVSPNPSPDTPQDVALPASTGEPISYPSPSTSTSPTIASSSCQADFTIHDATLQRVWPILDQCMKRIEAQLNTNPRCEGIFRIPTSTEKIESFMTLFNSGEASPRKNSFHTFTGKRSPRSRSQSDIQTRHRESVFIRMNDAQQTDEHFLPCLFKRMLRDHPLIPLTHQASFASIGQQIASDIDKETITTELRQAVEKLPPDHRGILKQVIRFTKQVSTFHETTQMPPQNLATALGPNILLADGLETIAINNGVTRFMIENYEGVFT